MEKLAQNMTMNEALVECKKVAAEAKKICQEDRDLKQTLPVFSEEALLAVFEGKYGKILTPELLTLHLKNLDKNLEFIRRNPGLISKLALAIFPVTINGDTFPTSQVEEHQYFRTLYLNQNGECSDYFEAYPHRYASMMPEYLQRNCVITVTEDLAKLPKQFIKAYNNLRAFFGLSSIKINLK